MQHLKETAEGKTRFLLECRMQELEDAWAEQNEKMERIVAKKDKTDFRNKILESKVRDLKKLLRDIRDEFDSGDGSLRMTTILRIDRALEDEQEE
jgi:hypothetical protein